jgi:hypothetical protein
MRRLATKLELLPMSILNSQVVDPIGRDPIPSFQRHRRLWWRIVTAGFWFFLIKGLAWTITMGLVWGALRS